MEVECVEEAPVHKRNISQIKNKKRRLEEYLKLKRAKQKLKKQAQKKRRKEAEALGENAPPKQAPRTIENTREPDDTMVQADDEEVRIHKTHYLCFFVKLIGQVENTTTTVYRLQVQLDEAMDEMAAYFRKEYVPKLLITTSDNPHTRTIKFCRELKQSIPYADFRWRNRSRIKKTVEHAIERGYSDIAVINEDRRHPNGLLLTHLPDGPTAYFRISNVKFCKDIKGRAAYSAHRPEVILNNFNTRLGHSVARMLASLFHYDPEFQGRRVVTFHNQRDYIFFRHHRYEFRNAEKVSIQEIGPRFTLRLKSLQKGTFDSKFGEYEWVLKRHEMETSRRRFFL
ncbi:ribosome production factor 1 isoform X1 [Dermacentor andersoni]|uniref:ribosome production factor 1 isoform X1 n=1 Tax=Dermacentor andersoni TaxID=34620 RepID=UPI003B3AE44C